jgi:hypothetical protein
MLSIKTVFVLLSIYYSCFMSHYSYCETVNTMKSWLEFNDADLIILLQINVRLQTRALLHSLFFF